MNYMVTSNHNHLIVFDKEGGEVSAAIKRSMMKGVAVSSAREARYMRCFLACSDWHLVSLSGAADTRTGFDCHIADLV